MANGKRITCTGRGFINGRMAGNMKVYDNAGEYYMDKKQGFGIYSWTDGRRYEGQWMNGKQHGEGKYLLPDGKENIGIWEKGKRIKWIKE